MDLGEFFRTLRRQWILTLLLLLLTLFAVYQANIKFSGPYQAESVIVLLPSSESRRAQRKESVPELRQLYQRGRRHRAASGDGHAHGGGPRG